ncbi:MAG: hypothetical protein WCK18_18945 [Prolixibacteraceae bacterium]
MKKIALLKDVHLGQTCYIIGTGKSALKLTSSDFGDGFVIAINSILSYIESLNLTIPVYSQYKDGNYPEPQCTVLTCENCIADQPPPKQSVLLLHVHHALNCFPDYEPKYYFDNYDYGLRDIDFSHKSAVRNAEFLGASQLIFYGFDSITKNDSSNISGAIDPNYKRQKELMEIFDYHLPYIYK